MGQTNYTINEQIRSMHEVTCPNCHSREFKILGLKGAMAKELGLGWLFGPIAHLVVNSESKQDYSLKPIGCKCKICRNKFEIHPPIAKPDEILDNPCVISFTRQSSFVGMAVSYGVWLNGVKVGTIDNGKTITFETSVRHNVVFVTDMYGVAFKDDYRFDAESGGAMEFQFKR